ncbi:E3 SUMO-protein ligase pli1 [Sporothrix bragantina]|uniref:E3 SUMO-protein ligase pli1 n=1 Tax=Sporothrix bragantina TaxID=671064 RepID=A0ABP0C4U7_9PEZI
MASQQEEVNRLVATIQMLKNRDLISICQSNNLVKSGNKADLHKRIINFIDASVHDPNQRNFINIRNSILQVSNGTMPANYRVPNLSSSSLPSSPSYNNGHAAAGSPYQYNSNGIASTNGRSQHFSHQGLQFKPSPFYQIETALGDVRQCEAMAQHRNSITIVIRASQYPDLQKCLNDPAMRVMIFCAANNYDVQDIAFPYQCEIKVNGGEIKANLRGLKNKPGSTRPVDITPLVRLKPPTYGNSLEFTYALTSKRFYLAFNPAPYEALAVDEYVKDILENTSSELDQVTIDPDGTWHTEKTQDRANSGSVSRSTPPRVSGGPEMVATLLDDEFEILSTPVPKRSNGYSNGNGNGGSTNGTTINGNLASSATLVNSRDTTATPSQTVSASGGGLNSNNKRPREVIDLTLSSDDEDDEPLPRRLKRQHTGNGYGGGGDAPALYADIPNNSVFS